MSDIENEMKGNLQKLTQDIGCNYMYGSVRENTSWLRHATVKSHLESTLRMRLLHIWIPDHDPDPNLIVSRARHYIILGGGGGGGTTFGPQDYPYKGWSLPYAL